MVDFLIKNWLAFLIIGIVSYLIGGINSSIISTKILGINEDVRTLGSGNAGFTNALRALGKKAAILTFVGDFTKGVLAIFVAVKIASFNYFTEQSMFNLKFFCFFASFMCVLGHIYPCFFGFKGGKGILTAWATTLLIDYRIFLTLISVFLVVLILTKIVSIASIFAAVSYPISAFLIGFFAGDLNQTIVATAFSFVTALIVVIKHRGNIKRILNGQEKKFSVRKAS